MTGTGRDLGYARGWQRFGFGTLDFMPVKVHGGSVESQTALAFDRGAGKPFLAFLVIPPGPVPAPQLGMHLHRDDVLGGDVEEWYIVIEGTGIQRFSNGDSVAFGPGDVIATYPGTCHSLEVTGEKPVKLVVVAPQMYTTPFPAHDPWPEMWAPRTKVLTTNAENQPITAACRDCGATWERPAENFGSNTLSAWAVAHKCTKPVTPLHCAADQRAPAST